MRKLLFILMMCFISQAMGTGYYTDFTISWFKSPADIGFTDISTDLYIGDVAVDPVTGYVLVLDGTKYGPTSSDWSTKVNINDTVSIAVLNPVDGSLYGRITAIPFLNGWGVSPTALTVTEDGVVLLLGNEGSVMRFATATSWNGSTGVKIIGSPYYKPEDSTPLYGNGFALSAVGKYNQGRCLLVAHRNNTFFLFGNTPANKDSFNIIKYGAVAYGSQSGTGEMIQGLALSHDAQTVYTYRGSNLGVRKFVDDPFTSFMQDSSTTYTFKWESSMDIDWDYNLIATAGIHNDTGTDLTQDYIRVCLQSLDGQGIGTGNGGTGVYVRSSSMRVNNNLIGGVAIHPTRGEVFAAGNSGLWKLAGSRFTTSTPVISTIAIVPKPQSMIQTTGNLTVDRRLDIVYHFVDSSTRIQRAMQALSRDWGISAPTVSKITVFLGIYGYDSAIATRCTQEGISVTTTAEGYALAVSASGITIVGRDLPGLFHGIMTLRQLHQTGTSNYLPYVRIEDYPKLSFRGVHTFTGKNALAEQKRLVDMMALWKMNQIVMQIDYMEFKRHPEIWYANYGQSQADVKTLVDYARERFIEISPLVQGPGHCEWIFRNGVHWDLAEDSTPSPGHYPYAYMITNDSTYTFMSDIWDEAINVFQPKYVHIGHDEPTLPTYVSFPDRSTTYSVLQLMQMDGQKVSQYFANKNIDLMLWGDMLLHSSESPGAALAGSYSDATALRGTYKQLESNPGYPKFNIADWHYGSTNPYKYTSVTVFQNEGFPVLASPWYDHNNIRNLTLQAVDKGSKGTLQTTWAGFSFSIEANTGSYYQFEAYLLAADYSWSGRKEYITGLGYDPKTLFWSKWNNLKSGAETVMDASITPVADWSLMQ